MKKSLIAAASLLALAMAGEAAAVPVYGVTGNNNLVKFDSSTPGTFASEIAITGLIGGDSIMGIDFRANGGQLYGLGSGSRLYTINTTTGAATQVGASGAFALNGGSFGFDFNPTVDRIRVVSNTDQNLRLNPNDGTLVLADGTLAYAAGDPNVGVNPNVVGSAYTNSFAGPPNPQAPTRTTTLYNIDFGTDTLVTQIPPNAGTLNTIGSLGVNTDSRVGFDIFFFGNLAFASLTSGVTNFSSFYSINLATGAATLIGGLGNNRTIRDIALQQVPEPATLALFGLGLTGLMLARRKNGLKA